MSDDFEIVNVRLPRELHRQAKARAVEDERSLAALVRVALRRYLADTGPTTEGLLDEAIDLASRFDDFIHETRGVGPYVEDERLADIRSRRGRL